MSLEEQLYEIAKKSQETIPRRVMEIIRIQINDLAESGILDRSAKIHSRIPDSELLDTQGNAVHLTELCAKGLLVVSFYRGGW